MQLNPKMVVTMEGGAAQIKIRIYQINFIYWIQ